MHLVLGQKLPLFVSAIETVSALKTLLVKIVRSPLTADAAVATNYKRFEFVSLEQKRVDTAVIDMSCRSYMARVK